MSAWLKFIKRQILLNKISPQLILTTKLLSGWKNPIVNIPSRMLAKVSCGSGQRIQWSPYAWSSTHTLDLSSKKKIKIVECGAISHQWRKFWPANLPHNLVLSLIQQTHPLFLMRGNQLAVSDASWQQGSKICFAIFIQWKIQKTQQTRKLEKK